MSAAHAGAGLEERHLWLVRLLQWLRAPGPRRLPAAGDGHSTTAMAWPHWRLKQLLDSLDLNPDRREGVRAIVNDALAGMDATGLLADHGFAPRAAFFSEVGDRLRRAVLPISLATTDMGEVFGLVFEDDDARWISAIDTATLQRILMLLVPDGAAPDAAAPWQRHVVEALQLLASQIRAAGLAPLLRTRMGRHTLANRPFHQLAHVAEALRRLHEEGEPQRAAFLQQVTYQRALLAACREAVRSVHEHLDEHGISVDVVFEAQQTLSRCDRMEDLLDALVSPEPARGMRDLIAGLVEKRRERRGLRAFFAQHYALLARKVTERSAATGAHYIGRDRSAYRLMLRRAAGGGALLGVTTLVKLGLGALALTAFWSGWWSGINYALSFVAIYLLHGAVATKQPAMTAPTLAAQLRDATADDRALKGFVDEVTHLIRTQSAGIIGNLALVVPIVMGLLGWAQVALGRPALSEQTAHYLLHSHQIVGASLLYAAFTGVLLFLASLMGGWAENWFVLHRLDSAIAWSPRALAWWGQPRMQRIATWWRTHIAGMTTNVALGMMLGLVPALASFFALPIEVRHVTLSTGQVAAAASVLGWPVLQTKAFWLAVASLPLIGALNVAVSFTLAFRLALSARGVRIKDRSRIYAAVRKRLWQRPGEFFVPPRDVPAHHPNP